MSQPAYFVKDGHTLGFVYDEQPHLFNVLAGKPQLGGHDWKDGFVPISPKDSLIPATLEDFERFRVCHKGHLPDAYEAAKAQRAPLEREAFDAGAALRVFPKGPMGMTPQAVKDTPEFKAAYQRYARAAAALAAFNGPFCKAFAKEIRAEIHANRLAGRAGQV